MTQTICSFQGKSKWTELLSRVFFQNVAGMAASFESYRKAFKKLDKKIVLIFEDIVAYQLEEPDMADTGLKKEDIIFLLHRVTNAFQVEKITGS